MVFLSISSAIANMSSAKKAGKIMGVTVSTFLVTAAIAAVIMYAVVSLIPVVPAGFTSTETVAPETASISELIVNFFTKPDFTELWSRRAILPLIVAAIIFGFAVQMNGGPKTRTAVLLQDLTNCVMKAVKIITCMLQDIKVLKTINKDPIFTWKLLQETVLLKSYRK